MIKSKKTIIKKDFSITIDGKKVFFNPEFKKSIDLEILFLTIPLFAIVALFSVDYIGWPIFLVLFYVIAMRIFIANHDRYHADKRNRLPRFLELIAENFAIVVTPWDETFDSIKRKHIKHHVTHNSGKSSKYYTRNDPHSVFELRGFTKVILSCLFYEEIQLYLDVRDSNFKKSRFYRFLLYFPLQLAYIYYFGWGKFLIVMIAMRIVGSTAWFVFSWVIHQPIIYKFGFSKKVPKLFKWLFALLHGRRVTEGCLHHTTHHAWPSIPYNQLYKFDSVILQNPDLAPDMKPIKR